MRVVIDTNIICNSCNTCIDSIHVLAEILYNPFLFLSLDNENKLEFEYRNTANRQERSEFFIKWFKNMEEQGKISYLFVRTKKSIETNLTKLSFHGEVDKLVVYLALESTPSYIATEDSDFGKGSRGEEHSDVLDYLNKELNIIVHDTREALEYLRSYNS